MATQRLKRIRWLSRGFFLASVALLFVHPYAVFAILQLTPLWIMLANRLLRPFQERVNQGFIDQAVDKLDRFKPVTVGITGSFGKTTTKHIFAEILESAGPVFYSPGSINTVPGAALNLFASIQSFSVAGRGSSHSLMPSSVTGIRVTVDLLAFAAKHSMTVSRALVFGGPDEGPAGRWAGTAQQEGSGRACSRVKVPSVSAKPISSEICVVIPFA